MKKTPVGFTASGSADDGLRVIPTSPALFAYVIKRFVANTFVETVPFSTSPLGNAAPLALASTSARVSLPLHISLGNADMPANAALDHLTKAHRVSRSSVKLMFGDGFTAILTLSEMGLTSGDVTLQTAKASDTGLIIQPRHGRKIVIDSATLRYISDPEYAEHMDSSVASLLIPSERLERIAGQNQPPQEWYDSTEEQ